MSEANPDDVRAEIDTNLDDEEIDGYIDDEVTELSISNDLTALDADVRRRLEVLGACIRILDRRERARAVERRESARVDYEVGQVAALTAERQRIAHAAGIDLPDARPQADFGVF